MNEGIRVVPTSAAERIAVRNAAHATMSATPGNVPDRAGLEQCGRAVLARCNLPEANLGYAMVACSNAIWREAFASIPPERRLLLLPHCLRSHATCRAPTDTAGLHCAACGNCDIPDLSARAEALGYKVVVAEGTSAVAEDIVERGRDAVLGVACLESLDRSFERVSAMGLPFLAVPLLGNGCVDTACDQQELDSLLALSAPPRPASHRSFLPLLRFAARLADANNLAAAFAPLPSDEAAPVAALACDWLAAGGKRIRAFCTLAAYAARRHGEAAFTADATPDTLLPVTVQRVALAMETLHKASLVHDDIEDDEHERYGQPVPHRRHGLALAINLGDHLLGLGYSLVAAQRAHLGAEAVADIVAVLSDAHRELCLGQGAELLARELWHAQDPLAVLDIAARKTAPAFAAALYAGLRCAGPVADNDAIQRFARYLGESYQVLDDLDDWRKDDAAAGEDVRRRQPTILAALAAKAGYGDELAAAATATDATAQVRALYERCGAFAQARTLAERLRERAADSIAAIPGPTVQELLRFLLRTATAPQE